MLCFLLLFCSEKCKARGFTVIVDGRKSQWNIVKTVVLMLQVGKRGARVFEFLLLFDLEKSIGKCAMWNV